MVCCKMASNTRTFRDEESSVDLCRFEYGRLCPKAESSPKEKPYVARPLGPKVLASEPLERKG